MPWYIPILSAVVGGVLGFAASLLGGVILSKISRNLSLLSFRNSIKIEVSFLVEILNDNISISGTEMYIRCDKFDNLSKMCVVYTGNSSLIGLLDQSNAISIVKFYGCILSLAPHHLADEFDYYDKSDLTACLDAGLALLKTI